MNFRNTLSRRKEKKKINSKIKKIIIIPWSGKIAWLWTGAKRGFGRLDPPMAPIDKNLPKIRHCLPIIPLILRINSAQNFLTNLKLCLNY